VLLLPGLAAQIAGPASLLAWAGLLALSGAFAVMFTGFGVSITHGGVAAYAAAGLGDRLGRAVAGCFLAGVVAGAPIVCLIGAGYLGMLIGASPRATVLIAAGLLALIVVITLLGGRVGAGLQLALVVALVIMVAVATIGSAPHGQAGNWTPFAPHGWSSVGHAASALMLSFVGWEAIAPMTNRLRNPRRQLPRVITVAFVVTAAVYLALAVSTISVLGSSAGGRAPLASLMASAVGSAGRLVAAGAAIALTVAAVNAYVSGAVALADAMRRQPAAAGRKRGTVQIWIVLVGVLLLASNAAGFVSVAGLVAIPTSLFVTVYLGCTASGARFLHGRPRVAATIALPVVAAVLAFSGWALIIVAMVAAVGGFSGRGALRHRLSHRGSLRGPRATDRHPGPACA
jgi:amino acid efflux transporter